MTHKEQMQRGIEAALDAMPKRMRGCDMAHLFAQFIITYDMEPDTADIAVQTAKLIRMYIDDCSDEDLQTVSAIRDADHFLAKIQAGEPGMISSPSSLILTNPTLTGLKHPIYPSLWPLRGQ